MNAVTIRIPIPLRAFTGGADEIAVTAGTVGDALTAMGCLHGGLLQRILTPRGELRPFVNVFVGDTNIRELAGLDTPLQTGDVLAIIPAVAGGLR